MLRRALLPGLGLAALTLVPPPARLAPQPPQDGGLVTEHVAGHVSMLVGRGGNIAVSVGDDGALLVDDKFPDLTDAILASVGELTDGPVRWVVNTHWHGDHTGGNANLARAGATLVAHDNVRLRLSTSQDRGGEVSPPAPEDAWPRVTFDEGLSLHVNGDTVRVFHVDPAHTDGDSVVHFEGADVVHMGDTFFNGMYPYIDVSSGGHLPGLVAAADRVLARCDEDTRIIPGHGPVGDADDLRAYRDMLATVHERLLVFLEEGKSLEEVVAAEPTADLDEVWGGGYFRAADFLGFAYTSLQR